ncbi:MAG TPA: response regulator [Micropepsaceae bacterium]|nr:response regulator [Micropepsaceae bacterium]
MSYRFDRLKVLVIDDNQHMRRLVSAVLEAVGIKTVFEAENANDAWKIFQTEPWDLIFLDWVMSGMSGLEFAEKIRTSPDSPNPFIPIVMLTGYSSIERVNAARDVGINEFLAKPVSAKAIMNRLVAVIEHPRSFVRTKGYFGPCRRRRREGAYHGPERRASELETQDTSPNAA